MPEPDEQKRDWRAIFTRTNLIRLGISVLVSMVLGMGIDFILDAQKRAELSSVRANAYLSIAQFAPWNIAQRYVGIVFTQGNSYAEQLARQQEQQSLLFRSLACDTRGNYTVSGFNSDSQDNPCAPAQHPRGLRAFYLSAHVPFPLRPVTAFFDLLLHAIVDQGIVGFLVAAAQVAIGVLFTRFAIRLFNIKVDTFYSYVLGLPLGILVLGSLAAIPLWLLALGGITALKAFPAGGLGAQAGGTAYLASWIGRKAVEEVGHEAVMKQVERVVRD